MSKIEIVMLCLAYAIGRIPHLSEIRRAKNELSHVDPRSVNMVIRSAHFLYPYMTDTEISLFKEHVCTCMLSAVNYRIPLTVTKSDTCGYAVCPRCNVSLERDFQTFCDRCGQHLKWIGRKHIKCVNLK